MNKNLCFGWNFLLEPLRERVWDVHVDPEVPLSSEDIDPDPVHYGLPKGLSIEQFRAMQSATLAATQPFCKLIVIVGCDKD